MPGGLIRACVTTVVVTVALACLAGTSAARAATTTFSANGSAEQVYVTGLGAGQRMTLVNSAGRKVATQAADSLGGLLFRNVKPGAGYRVRPALGGQASGPVTVHSNAAAPWIRASTTSRSPPAATAT